MTVMPRFKRILVPVDGSQCSKIAFDFALRLAKAHSGAVFACNVIDFATLVAEATIGYEEIGDSNNQTRILSDVAQRADDVGVELSAFKLEGRPVVEILECAAREEVDVIVIGSNGRRGLERFFVGSTAEGVLRGATVPVITVHDNARADVPPKTIVAAIDDSQPSDAAADCAIGIAATEHSKLVFCSIIALRPYIADLEPYGFDTIDFVAKCEDEGQRLLRHALERARAAGIESAQYLMPRGEPVDEILAIVESQRADLLVIGTHGRRGFQRMLLGSVAEGVIRRSAVPVMVVRLPSLVRDVRGERLALVDDVR